MPARGGVPGSDRGEEPVRRVRGDADVHAAVQEDVFWEVIEGLHKAGASEILVAPIEKLVK